MQTVDRSNGKINLEDLQKIEGIGTAKATLIAAAFELARRRIRPEGLKITFPPEVMPLIRDYADRRQDHFLCISLNGANEVTQQFKTAGETLGIRSLDHIFFNQKEYYSFLEHAVI